MLRSNAFRDNAGITNPSVDRFREQAFAAALGIPPMSRASAALDPRSPVIRPDPLATAYARKRIDHAQYMAGREFQRLYHLADKRRPDQPERSRRRSGEGVAGVDGVLS